eukprot:gene23108-29941_t
MNVMLICVSIFLVVVSFFGYSGVSTIATDVAKRAATAEADRQMAKFLAHQKEENERDTDDLIKRHQTTSPIQIIPIAEELGLSVYKIEDWPNDLSGKLQKDTDSKSGFSIYVNANHPDERRRFTIAHEIAHFILHRHLIEGDVLVDDALYRSGLSNAVEAAANKMAADILMPWRLIDSSINSGINTVPDLAKQFKVSNSAMSIRLGVPD